MSGTYHGTVHKVMDTQSFGEKGFKKRLLICIEDNGRWTNYVPFELTRDMVDMGDSLAPDDEVEINYRLNGREWQKDADSETKYFLSAEVTNIQKVDAQQETVGAAPADDDIPF